MFTTASANGNKAPAFEIDSMFKSAQSGNNVVSCGNDSGTIFSNLPSPYIDTELSDDDAWRVCTVGTQNTSDLQTWYLYWTWRSLDNLKTNENPYMRFSLQPSEACYLCGTTLYYSWPALCTCAISSPSNLNNNDGDHWWQWIIEYNYWEAPGVEKSWIRN